MSVGLWVYCCEDLYKCREADVMKIREKKKNEMVVLESDLGEITCMAQGLIVNLELSKK